MKHPHLESRKDEIDGTDQVRDMGRMEWVAGGDRDRKKDPAHRDEQAEETAQGQKTKKDRKKGWEGEDRQQGVRERLGNGGQGDTHAAHAADGQVDTARHP